MKMYDDIRKELSEKADILSMYEKRDIAHKIGCTFQEVDFVYTEEKLKKIKERRKKVIYGKGTFRSDESSF